MKTLAKLVSMACSLALPLVLSASTWYVDDDNYNEAYSDAAAYIAAGFDGTTETKAFGTIQAATDSGNGSGAIRCFGTRNTWGIQLRGFTLRNGATASSYSGDSQYSKIHGGAVLVVGASTDYPMYVLDCVITNCSGRYSVVRYGTICRSFIADNLIGNDGSIGSGTQFYSCIFTRNYGSSASVLGSISRAVHCTIVGNQTKYAATSSDYLYNSIMSLSHNSYFSEFSGTPTHAAANVTATANGNYQTIAPLLDDYRVLAGAADIFAKHGEIAAKMKSAPGPGPSDYFVQVALETRRRTESKNMTE